MSLNETETREQLINPAIESKGWNDNLVRKEYSYTEGKILIEKNGYIEETRGEPKRIDYLLYYNRPGMPLAIIEAKRESSEPVKGLNQAINYANDLNIKFAYSSNGKYFIEKNLFTDEQRIINIDEFPTKEELWNRFLNHKGLTHEQGNILAKHWEITDDNKPPRYYQINAVNAVVEGVIKEKDRMLLVMATGVGKTYVAFNIVNRLLKSNLKKRVLFLADLNSLIDQTMKGDFKPFVGKMTKISERKIEAGYNVYMSLYHQLTKDGQLSDNIKELSRDFFDVIVIDECHRGSAKEDSVWREVLNYFSSATQIGLTATPRNDDEASNSDYFGEAVYTYSMNQGMEDGFLAPYKVNRITQDIDISGIEMDDKVYSTKHYDKDVIIPERTKKIVEKITQFLKDDPYQKTIIFCQDTEHAARMKEELIKQNKALQDESDNKYIMRITGNDEEGKLHLEDFCDVSTKYPTVVTTSELLSTGIDCKTCKLIVIDKNVKSMRLFKQIVGRGTRVDEKNGKTSFTIMDFRNVTELFKDPEWDGEPQVVNICDIADDISKLLKKNRTPSEKSESEHREKIVIDQKVSIVEDIIIYYDEHGKEVRDTITNYSKKKIKKKYETKEQFKNTWISSSDSKGIINDLNDSGALIDILKKNNSEVDEYDIVMNVAYDEKMVTKEERINNFKENELPKYTMKEKRKVAEIILDEYSKNGVEDLDDQNILKRAAFNKVGGPLKLMAKVFKKSTNFIEYIKDMKNNFYK